MARKIYRQPIIESLIGVAVLIQIISGFVLALSQWNKSPDVFKCIQIISGLYLAVFMIIHVAAVINGRYKLHVDTNLYYGAGVMNKWPHKLIFIPYYSFALLSFFFHIACIHKEKMSQYISATSAETQCLLIMFVGVIITAAIIFRMAALKSCR